MGSRAITIQHTMPVCLGRAAVCWEPQERPTARKPRLPRWHVRRLTHGKNLPLGQQAAVVTFEVMLCHPWL